MSQVQNSISVLPVALGTAVCLLLFMTVSMAAARRKISRLQKDLKRLSEDVKVLQVAEQRRFVRELKDTKKEDDQTSTAHGDVGGEALRLVAGKDAIRS